MYQLNISYFLFKQLNCLIDKLPLYGISFKLNSYHAEPQMSKE